MSHLEVKRSLKLMNYPDSVIKSLEKIENFIVNRSNLEFVVELIGEVIFLENLNDTDARINSHQQPENLSLIQELQLVIILTDYFARPGSDSTKNAIFLSLFGRNITNTRTNVLKKLVSVSISAAIPALLCAAATWMQQLSCTSIICSDLVQCLINDFVTFSKSSSEQLIQLPLLAPRFAANFMTSVVDFYLNVENETLVPPPDMLLELFTEWITDMPSLCVAAEQPIVLPAGAIEMPPLTPLVGLIRWTVLAPLINQKGIYNKLHLALLETILQIPVSNSSSTALNAQNLALIVNPLNNHSKKLITENINPENDNNLQTSLERYAQTIQVGIASKCISGNITQLLRVVETLPKNNLMTIVLKTNVTS